MELAAAGEDMKKLREIAKVHIARCEAGDMQVIKELADRLDGKPAQMLEHSGPDSEPITKVVNEIVHVYQTPEDIAATDGEETPAPNCPVVCLTVKPVGEPDAGDRHVRPLLIEWREVRDGNGSGGPNEDTARRKR